MRDGWWRVRPGHRFPDASKEAGTAECRRCPAECRFPRRHGHRGNSRHRWCQDAMAAGTDDSLFRDVSRKGVARRCFRARVCLLWRGVWRGSRARGHRSDAPRRTMVAGMAWCSSLSPGGRRFRWKVSSCSPQAGKPVCWKDATNCFAMDCFATRIVKNSRRRHHPRGHRRRRVRHHGLRRPGLFQSTGR